MSLSHVPPELILTIADNLPTASLSRFLRTCRSIQALLAPVLTKRITTEHLATSVLKSGIAHNHLPTVHLALTHNAHWHTKPKRRPCYNALKAACDRNRLDIVAVLLTHYGPGIINQLGCHANPFVTALKLDNVGLATVLYDHENGVAANLIRGIGPGMDSRTPLELAAIYGAVRCTEALIKRGAAVGEAQYALFYATNNDHWDVASVLLRAGVPVSELTYVWGRQAPLGSRSPEEIAAWVEAGIMFLEHERRECMAEWVSE